MSLTPFWISFWTSTPEHFEYHGPWWESGSDFDDRRSLCAAVMAEDEEDAKRIISKAFDDGFAPDDWRFAEPEETAWSPFNDRFQRQDWMKWPWPGPALDNPES